MALKIKGISRRANAIGGFDGMGVGSSGFCAVLRLFTSFFLGWTYFSERSAAEAVV